MAGLVPAIPFLWHRDCISEMPGTRPGMTNPSGLSRADAADRLGAANTAVRAL